MTGGPSVRASLGKSDSSQIIHGQSSTKYTMPSDPKLRSDLNWARTHQPMLLKDYINADSALFHNLSKRGFNIANTLKVMEETLTQIVEARAKGESIVEKAVGAHA